MMTRDSGKQPPVTTDDLHAYADGLLPALRVEQVEAYLADNSSEAARVAEYRAINRALGRVFDDVISKPIPDRMLDTVNRKSWFSGPQLTPSLRRWTSSFGSHVVASYPGSRMLIAASLSWLAIGLGVGWIANGSMASSTDPFARLTRAAQTAYVVYSPEKLHPVEVSAEQSDHLSSWLSNRLGRHMPIPSLMDLGYSFMGGRLLTGHEKPAAMLMYQNAKGQRLVLYVSTELDPTQDAQMEFEQSRDAAVVTWARGGTGFGVAGSFDEDELMPAANLLRAQISI